MVWLQASFKPMGKHNIVSSALYPLYVILQCLKKCYKDLQETLTFEPDFFEVMGLEAKLLKSKSKGLNQNNCGHFLVEGFYETRENGLKSIIVSVDVLGPW